MPATVWIFWRVRFGTNRRADSSGAWMKRAGSQIATAPKNTCTASPSASTAARQLTRRRRTSGRWNWRSAAFAWLDRHAHDAVNGGYYEALTREGRPILSPPGRRTSDFLGAAYGYKSMNSHIHLLEALTALFHVWSDPLLQTRMREVFLIVRDKIAVEPGCLNLFFTPDWRAVPDYDSFGHDVETAYLLLEAAAALKEADDPKTLAVARSLVNHALEWGWDERLGGFYDKGAAFAPAHAREKVWWTQAEGLNSLLLMHEHFGGQTSRYFDAFLKQWDFIGNYQTDHRYGEWYNTVSAEGTSTPGEAKGTVWKAAYHNGRALMNVSETLRRLAR